MNTVTCTGCGDTHLCAGSRPPTTDTSLLATLEAFVADTFDTNPISYVPSIQAWFAYLNWCTANQKIPVSQRRFIPAMGLLGYPRVKRSTMRLAGLAWRTPDRAGRHAAPEPVSLAR